MSNITVIENLIGLIITSVRCAKEINSLIQRLQEAPDDLLALSNEVSDSALVLLEFERASNEISRSTDFEDVSFTQLAASYLERGNELWPDLKSLITSVQTTLPDGSVKLNAYQWLRLRSKTQKLKERLRNIRVGLHELLNCRVASGTVRIEVLLNSINTEGNQQYEDVTTHLSKIEKLGEQTISRLDQVTRIYESLDQPDPRKTLDSSRKMKALDGGAFDQYPKVSKLANEEAYPAAHILGTSDISSKPNRVQGKSNQAFQPSMISSASICCFQVQRRLPCESPCACECHKAKNWISPPLLSNIIGSLFVGYAGALQLTPKCTVGSCGSDTALSFKLIYRFPSWFMRRNFHIIASVSSSGEPSLGLTVYRRIELDEDNGIFQLIQSGDVAALKSALDHRLISPYDLRAETGEPALMYALRIGHQRRGEMIKILLSAGANPFQENDHGVSAIHLVRKRIAGNRGDAPYRELLRQCFPDTILHDGWEMTDLHRSVLGMLHVKLGVLLDNREHRREVNLASNDGSTALHWAAARGDAEAVQELLLSGADINARDEEGTTPLSYAFLTVNPAAAKVLIKAGADVTARNIYGNEPIHYAGNRSPLDLSPIDSLIRGGADVDSKNKENYTALFYAINSDKTPAVTFLLDRGASLSHRDIRGHTPILLAVIKNSRKSFQILLDRGAECDAVDRKGASLLHLAAQHADMDTIHQLILSLERTPWPFRDIEVNAKDGRGVTAIEIVEKRAVCPEGFRLRFEQLLASMEIFQTKQDETESDDDFEDASEYQDS